MNNIKDGPATKLFSPVSFKGNIKLKDLPGSGVSGEMIEALECAPIDECISWGIPFKIDGVVLIKDKEINLNIDKLKTEWLVFMHTTDVMPIEENEYGFISSTKGYGRLGEHTADYIIVYSDGNRHRIPIKRRYQINEFTRRWGEHSTESVTHIKPCPVRPLHEQKSEISWGRSQDRIEFKTHEKWMNWVYAWRNPYPDKEIISIRIEPKSGIIVLSGISKGAAVSNPLRWDARKKAIFNPPENEKFLPDLDKNGLLKQIKLDMGQVISAALQPVYPNENWERTRHSTPPEISANKVLIEYSAHPDAVFHLQDGRKIPVKDVEIEREKITLEAVNPANQKIILHVVEKGSKKIIPVKIHIHGESGEYLAPVDKHRIPNSSYFEDYGADCVYKCTHYCTYISGETAIKLPLGDIYIEISKGFEYKPVRKKIKIKPSTKKIVVELEKVLKWREKGWVASDTHVHFLSPQTAVLEGEAEGLNVVNILALQAGELMGNVGDFDGRTTFGEKNKDANGRCLVRVGTENRNATLGHISLLGYRGNIIAPISTGGPPDAAFGDPVGILQTEYAERCRRQDGLVVLSHFPEPRLENAAVIVSGNADAVEMRETEKMIDPFSVSDWYRYLNCGYILPVVCGTDKLEAGTTMGTGRVYAFLGKNKEFTYETWKNAVKKGNTFATTGPLLEFSVNRKLPCTRIKMSKSGGNVEIKWNAASAALPMSKVELVKNSEIIESKQVKPYGDKGTWKVKIEESSWLALLVRGCYPGESEIIGAHSSPVVIEVKGSRLFNRVDAETILEQIKGTISYIDTLGIRAEPKIYKRMRNKLTSILNRFTLLSGFK
jgi:hypothetical protein